MNAKLIDLTGQKFGKLFVIKRCGESKSGYPLWLCLCKCGNERLHLSGALRNGIVVSCGCFCQPESDRGKKLKRKVIR